MHKWPDLHYASKSAQSQNKVDYDRKGHDLFQYTKYMH